MRRLTELVARSFLIWVLLAVAAATVWPSPFTALGPWIPALLGVVMLGMGLTLRPEDFLRIARAPAAVAVILVTQWLVMPLGAVALVTALDLPPALAAGVILVGVAPGGTASNVVTLLARGDVALSVTCTAVATVLAPLILPLWVLALLGELITVGFTELFQSVALIVLVPVVLGIGIRLGLERLAPTAVPFALRLAPTVSVLVIAAIVGAVVALNLDALAQLAAPVFVAVVLHNAIGLAAGYTVARFWGLPAAQQRTALFEVGLQNSGLAVALASAYFSPAAALAGAVYSVWHNITGAALASWLRGRPDPTRTGNPGPDSLS